MYLKTLRIKGFKSFAKPVTLNFSKGLSVIVGPNGTGKSNIVDAILWVLGEQNPRFLRGQSMQDIIFSGTDRIKPFPLAEVTLVFDNSDSAIPLDSPEVSIKRVLSRDGTSQYFLNERPCRLIDLREAISHLNLGRELPGIVPQNRIFEMINPGFSDLKSIIEESSGVGYFRMRKENAERKLLVAQEKLEKIRLLESEIKKQLAPLRRQAEDYRKVIELKSEIEELKIKKALSELLDCRKKHDHLEKEIQAVENEINRLDSELESLDAKKRMLESLAEKNSSIARQAGYLSKLSDFQQNFSFIRLLLEEKAKNALDRISSQAQIISSLSAEIKKKQEAIESAKTRKNELEIALREVKERRKGLMKEIEKLEAEKQVVDKEIFVIEKELNKQRKEEETAVKRVQEIDFELKKIEEERLRIRQRIKKISSFVEEVSREVLEIARKEEDAANELESLQQEMAGLHEKITALQEKHEKERLRFEEAVSERRTLEAGLQNVEQALKSFETNIRKAEDLRPFSEEELKKLQQVLPHDEPLYVVFNDEANDLKNPPVHFILSSKEKAVNDLDRMMENIEKIAEEKGKNFPAGVFYHPAGFFYRSSFGEGYYHLLEKKRELETLLPEAKKREIELAENLNKLKTKIKDLNEKLTTLTEKENELKETLRTMSLKKQKLAVQIDFKEEESKRLEEEAEALRKRKVELENLKNEVSKMRENAFTAVRDWIHKKREKEALGKKLVIAIQEIKDRLNEVERHESQTLFELKMVAKEIEENERRISESARVIKVSNDIVVSLERRLKLLNEIHKLTEEFLDTIGIMRSAYSYLSAYEEEIRNQAREVSRVLELSQKLYERKSRLDSRKQILLSQLEELTRKIRELVKSVEEMALVPVDMAFHKYEVSKPLEDYAKQLKELEEKLGSIGEYNPFAIRDFEVLNARYEKIKRQGADIKNAMENLKSIIEEVDRKIVDAFRKSLDELNRNFERIYSIFTNGGKAEISVETDESIDEARFTIRVSQPGKNLKNINLLSGGEKSLASLALLMALEETFKFPFMVFDEVEAALDEVNLERFINYLKKVAENTQIIMITHQPLTVEAADVIYGVTVDREGSSRVYSLRLEQLEEFDVKL